MSPRNRIISDLNRLDDDAAPCTAPGQVKGRLVTILGKEVVPERRFSTCVQQQLTQKIVAHRDGVVEVVDHIEIALRKSKTTATGLECSIRYGKLRAWHKSRLADHPVKLYQGFMGRWRMIGSAN